MRLTASVWLLVASLSAWGGEMETARDRQDRAALESLAAKLAAEAEKAPGDAEKQYQAALAASYLAEVALELDRKSVV